MKRRTFIFRSFATGLSLAVLRPSMTFASDPPGIGYIGDPVFLKYHLFPDHPESPARYRYITDAVTESGLLDRVSRPDLKKDVQAWIKTLHTKQHIDSIQRHYPEAFEVASAAVGAALAAVDQVAGKRLRHVFCATRPPGHHALNSGKEEGFCYFNQVAIAARYAQQQFGYKRILIVDWDYHHGNSTETMFYDDADVLFFSSHDQYAYPGTGDPAKTGRAAGEGLNINIHLPCGTTDEMILRAYQERLVPAVEAYKPDFIFISAGFDSKQHDKLGCFAVTDAGFVALTRLIKGLANRHCDGRIVSILEGGYNLKGNADAVVAHVAALLEQDTPLQASGQRTSL